MAVFAALANNEIYYRQFRVELDAAAAQRLLPPASGGGRHPGENELFYLGSPCPQPRGGLRSGSTCLMRDPREVRLNVRRRVMQ